MMAITMTAYRRPIYTREVLKALSQCAGIENWLLVANIEPGHPKVVAEFHAFNACQVHLVVNRQRLGLNRNTLAALTQAMHLKATHVVHLEDDTVPSPDALLYFQWGIDFVKEKDDRQTIMHVSGYNRPLNEPPPDQGHICNTRPIWTPWGWGVDRQRLLWIVSRWCTRNPKCFTCSFRERFVRSHHELFPRLSRIQNIGYKQGENERTPEWYYANHRTPWVANTVSARQFTCITSFFEPREENISSETSHD